MCDLSVATGHKQKHPALTSSIKAGTRLTYPGGIEGWVHSRVCDLRYSVLVLLLTWRILYWTALHSMGPWKADLISLTTLIESPTP